MTHLISASSVAIRIAARDGTLRITEQYSERFGCAFFVIRDDQGTIEIASTAQDAEARVAACCDHTVRTV